MRVTNSMTTNTLLLNLNRNMTQLSKLQYQASTGNKIQYASDNPIIAGRALKFRSSVAEVEQYIQNTEQALSWVRATENAINNINEMMLSLKELNVQASSDIMTIEDKQKITTNIVELLKQMGSDMNAQYAGRYIFSGFKTDQPVTLTRDQADTSIDMTQEFTKEDISKEFKLLKNFGDGSQASEKREVNVIKLAYGDIDKDTLTISNLPEGYVIATKSPTDIDIYDPEDNVINYIEETGELILPKNFYNDLGENSISVTFTKTGFSEGDLNPVNYFNSSQIMEDGTIQNHSMDNQSLQFEVAASVKLQINSLGKDIFSVSLKNDLDEIINFASSTDIISENDLRELFKEQGLSDDEIEEKVKEFIADENKLYQNIFFEKLNLLLGKMDAHSTKISQEHTLIGSRLDRLELIESRLRDDQLNLTELRSDNESADVAETLIKYNAQLAVYQSSLSIGAQIMQKTLADFI